MRRDEGNRQNRYKERRKLLLLVRETPLHLGHFRLLVQVTEMGAIVMSPVPAFYHIPQTLEAIIDQLVNRALISWILNSPAISFCAGKVHSPRLSTSQSRATERMMMCRRMKGVRQLTTR